ncbi:MAG TPA: hypothetical protein VMI56_08655 [Reyranella sp.]|nr:hypothetical protein [Reyranella sp.]
MKTIATIASVGLLAALAPAVQAQSISKQGFNFNPPPCPGRSTGTTIQTNKFSDGSPLPSCGGREQTGNVIKTYELVWTGHVWAEYTPSVKTTTLAPPPAPAAPVAAPAHAPSTTPTLSSSLVSTLPEGSFNGTPVVLYQGNWVSLVASGGGNFATHLVASGGGNLVASGGGNLVGPSGGTYTVQSVGSGGQVHTSAGVIMLNAANVTKYKQAMGIR